jgi:hypothetical protein
MPGRFEAFAYQRGWLDSMTDPAVRQGDGDEMFPR